MNSIKFRGKSLLSGKWVYGDYFSQYKDGQRHYYILEHPFGLEGGRDTLWEIEPGTVCQPTGLKDKNRQYVYEGDWLHAPTKAINGMLVKWHPVLATWTLHGSKRPSGEQFWESLTQYKASKLEIRGSILESGGHLYKKPSKG